MSPDAFLDAQLSCDGLDVIAHHLWQPSRLLAALLTRSVAIGSENPVGGSMVKSLPVPLQQVAGDLFVDGNRLLKDLGLTPFPCAIRSHQQ
jgi:hypothetical protein